MASPMTMAEPRIDEGLFEARQNFFNGVGGAVRLWGVGGGGETDPGRATSAQMRQPDGHPKAQGALSACEVCGRAGASKHK